MTIEEWAIKHCVFNGMFEEDARKVVEIAKQHPSNQAMASRWHDKIDDYPVPMLAVLRMSINASAIEWIDANCPAAWYRSLFS